MWCWTQSTNNVTLKRDDKWPPCDYFSCKTRPQIPQCRTNDIDDKFTFLMWNAIITMTIAQMYAMSFPPSLHHRWILGASLVKMGAQWEVVFAITKLHTCSWKRLFCVNTHHQHPPGFGAIWKSWFRSILHVVIEIIILRASICFGLRSGEARLKSE